MPGTNEVKPGYTIEDCITVFSDQKTQAEKYGWFFWFVRESATDGLNLKMSYVDKLSGTHASHKHPEREFYYIMEGLAEVSIDGMTRVIGPNSSMFCPPNVMHGIKRANDQPLKYLVIKDVAKVSVSDDKSEKQPDYNLDNCITVFSDGKIDPAKTGWFFWFAPTLLTKGMSLKMTYVDKLTGTHPPHQHEKEEILYLLEGEAEVHINGETRIIGPNTGIYYPGNSSHCIKRINDQPIKYLVVNI